MRKRLYLATSLLTVATLTTGAVSATAVSPAAAKKYGSCKKLNAVYPHGVAKSKGLLDRNKAKAVVADPVTNYTVNAAVYNANKGLDRDHDGIACEKH